ncbi:hypothetical protein V8F33_009238 [Rhypophila sp. PSN 637]
MSFPHLRKNQSNNKTTIITIYYNLDKQSVFQGLLYLIPHSAMRSSWMTLILGATAVVQSTPTDVPLPSLSPRGYHPYGHVRWTLHDSCVVKERETPLERMVIAAIDQAKERSKLSVPILETWVTECVKHPKCSQYREQCELLFGPFGRSYGSVKDFEHRCNQAIDLEKLSKHYLNFVVYCAPDLGSSSTGSEYSMHDRALDEDIGLDTPLGRMYQDVKENAAQNDSYPSSRYTAPQLVTRQHTRPKYFGWGPSSFGSWAKRSRIAATITFHPVWLKTLAEREKGFESAVLHDGDYFAPDLRQLPCKEEEPVPIKRLERVSGLFHNELFRLDGLGRLGDDNGTRSYDWADVRGSANQKLPEFYMYLGLQMELWSRNLTLNYDGSVGELQE